MIHGPIESLSFQVEDNGQPDLFHAIVSMSETTMTCPQALQSRLIVIGCPPSKRLEIVHPLPLAHFLNPQHHSIELDSLNSPMVLLPVRCHQ